MNPNVTIMCCNDELVVYKQIKLMEFKRMGIKEIFRRIWLFSENKIKNSESVSTQPSQLIVELNSLLRQKLGTLNFHLLKNLKIPFVIFSIRGGELFDRVIEDEFVLTEKACVCFMRQVLEGVSFIHSKHILHLDLKVSHFLEFIKNTDL